LDCKPFHGIDQIIVGGESGPNARPCDVAWIRDIVQQCREAGVKCFVKQLGSNLTLIKPDWAKSRAGSDPSEWPEDLQVRELSWDCRAKAALEG
jgi:protein gp37